MVRRWEGPGNNLVGVVGRFATSGGEEVFFSSCCVTTAEVGSGAEADAATRGVAVVVVVVPVLASLSLLADLRGRGFGTTACCDAVVSATVSSLCGFSGGCGGPPVEGVGLFLGLGLATGLGFSALTSGKGSGVPFLLLRLWVGKEGWLLTFSYRWVSIEEVS